MFDSKSKKQDMLDNLFYETDNEKIFFFKSSKTLVRVDDFFVRIARKSSLTNLLLQGLDGEKSIALHQITAYQLKAPGKTVGYIQINYPGSQDSKGGVVDAVKDENSVTFSKTEIEQAVEIKKIIESAIIKNSK